MNDRSKKQEALSNLLPAGLDKLLGKLPGIKFIPGSNGLVGTVKLGEKRTKERNALDRAYDSLLSKLFKFSDWHPVTFDRLGWNGQTDTGDGRYASAKRSFVYTDGTVVELVRSTSFTTWTITVRTVAPSVPGQ